MRSPPAIICRTSRAARWLALSAARRVALCLAPRPKMVSGPNAGERPAANARSTAAGCAAVASVPWAGAAASPAAVALTAPAAARAHATRASMNCLMWVGLLCGPPTGLAVGLAAAPTRAMGTCLRCRYSCRCSRFAPSGADRRWFPRSPSNRWTATRRVTGKVERSAAQKRVTDLTLQAIVQSVSRGSLR